MRKQHAFWAKLWTKIARLAAGKVRKKKVRRPHVDDVQLSVDSLEARQLFYAESIVDDGDGGYSETAGAWYDAASPAGHALVAQPMRRTCASSATSMR